METRKRKYAGSGIKRRDQDQSKPWGELTREKEGNATRLKRALVKSSSTRTFGGNRVNQEEGSANATRGETESAEWKKKRVPAKRDASRATQIGTEW